MIDLGGEINFLGHSFSVGRYPNGLRYVFFAIDDNFDDPKDCTLLAVLACFVAVAITVVPAFLILHMHTIGWL